MNNVETLANIPYIISKGGEHYRSIGTKASPGTKVFALVGKVKHTGLVEVPMGTTLRQFVFDIGGGIPNNREFKAVQTGGPAECSSTGERTIPRCLRRGSLITQIFLPKKAAANAPHAEKACGEC